MVKDDKNEFFRSGKIVLNNLILLYWPILCVFVCA